MKLNEITGKEKATSIEDLIGSIRNGKFAKDGSHLMVKDDVMIGQKRLTSLIGCPKKVGNYFSCRKNKLTSLEGCPEEVGGNFSCGGNKLTSLEGIHKHLKKIDGSIFAYGNPIKSHVLGLLKIKGLKSVEIDNKEVQKIINKYLPLGDLLDCQEELIEHGFEEYAQL